MNENTNLCEILKNCPRGTRFYSPVYGEVIFHEVDDSSLGDEEIIIYHIYGRVRLNKYGVHYDFRGNGECILFPSKDQRDWSKFKCPKPKFDPKTLKPFDRVLVRNSKTEKWRCTHFSYFNEGEECPYVTFISYKFCVPYNDDTKHLVGTMEEAPEYYRYWEELI